MYHTIWVIDIKIIRQLHRTTPKNTDKLEGFIFPEFVAFLPNLLKKYNDVRTLRAISSNRSLSDRSVVGSSFQPGIMCRA